MKINTIKPETLSDQLKNLCDDTEIYTKEQDQSNVNIEGDNRGRNRNDEQKIARNRWYQ